MKKILAAICVLSFGTSLFAQENQYVTHQTGILQVSIFENGNIGHTGGYTEGVGVIYNGVMDAIYTSGLIFGTSARGSVNGHLGSFNINDDFVNTEPISDLSASPPLWDQVAKAAFNDDGAPNPYGLTVKQISRSNAGESSVLICYRLFSNGALINDLYAGLFADWDVGGGSFRSNIGGYDKSRNLAYQYVSDGANDSSYYGFVALNGMSGASVNSKQVSEGIRDSSFTWISTFRDEPVTTTGDYRMWIGTGPFTILDNDTVDICFAIVAGTDLANLQLNADAVIQKYNTITALPDDRKVVQQPSSFRLSQNYPNPFNPTTTIEYQLPDPADVSLSIYNLKGELITTLVSDHQQSGSHRVKWNPGNVSSGIYLYRIRAGNDSEIRKCMFLK